jgi:1-acyl-sn-glycerol-3-phosphate acyltransferase
MGVTVYSIKINGNYLAKPKWGDKMRHGSLVEAELDLLFTPEELETIEISEIKARVEERLYYDEFEWLKTHPKVHYRSRKLAEGLENILSICPECSSRYSIRTKGKRVWCAKCGLETELSDRYEFKDLKPFPNFADWYDWQCEKIFAQIEKDENFELSSRVELRHASKDGKTLLTLAGEGICTLNRNGLTYIGTEYGENVEKHFPLSKIYRLLFGAGEDFEIYDGKEIYYFTPEERKSCVDWYIASAKLNANSYVTS